MQNNDKKRNFANVIELDKHIEILLLSNDCVIVPDLGGFMAHHVDARYEKEEGIFLPPLRTIGFNPQLTMNDSLLVQSYIEAYDISYPEALRRIEDEVIEVKQHLDNENRYTFNSIGTLSINEEGNYVFEPCEAGILTPSLYGLSSFEMKTLAQTATAEKTAAQVINMKPQAVADNNIEENAKTTTLPFPELDSDDHRTINIKVSLLRNVAAACIAVVLFFALSGQLGTRNTASGTMQGNIDTSILTRIMPKDVTTHETKSTTSKVATSEMATTENAKVVENKANEDKKVSTQLSHNYYTIVLASQVSEGPANSFISELKKNGMDQAFLLKREGTSAKVVYGSYSSESEARKMMNELHSKKEFADSWVLKVD